MSQEAKFNCTLISVGSNLLTNSNGKEYAVATIEFVSANTGLPVQRSARIYKANLDKGMEVGQTYQATATVYGDNQVDVTVAPFAMGGNRATIEDFTFTEVEAPVLQSVGA